MSTFSEKVSKIQKQFPKDIILAKNGFFFIAIGKDALFLSEKLKLKKTCFGNEICKVGFPVKSSEKFIKQMIKEKIPFRVYLLKEDKAELIVKNESDLENPYKDKVNMCQDCKMKKTTEEEVLENLKKLIQT